MSESSQFTRREFLQSGAAAGIALVAAAGIAEAQHSPAVRKTRSYNQQMEYRLLGKTGVWVSAVCMGGHWKRIDKAIGTRELEPWNLPASDVYDPFIKNRTEILSCAIDHGINLVDACSSGEILTYSRALKGRRDKMFMDYSWYEKEMRFPEYRTTKALLRGLDEGLLESGLDHCDLWRVTCLMEGGQHTQKEVDGLIGALDAARKAGKCRFTGVSSHDRTWLKMLVETYPEQIQVIVSPYTADSKVMPEDSLFESVVKHRTGFLGIKPFSSNSLFKGDSSATSPTAAEDDRRARLAIRYILCNPALTAPIPGLITPHQVENVVAAIKERRELDEHERAELKSATEEMWANLPPDYEWLREWKYV
jgi:predicted aldo/keto reductase-like oxidoreductase